MCAFSFLRLVWASGMKLSAGFLFFDDYVMGKAWHGA